MYTERGKAKVKSFTPEQAAAFFKVARYDRWGWPFAFMLAAGARPGETAALRWEDVTFHPDGSASVKIERTRSVSQGKVYEDTPKTERGRRVVRLSKDTAGILRDSQAQQLKESRARLRLRGNEY